MLLTDLIALNTSNLTPSGSSDKVTAAELRAMVGALINELLFRGVMNFDTTNDLAFVDASETRVAFVIVSKDFWVWRNTGPANGTTILAGSTGFWHKVMGSAANPFVEAANFASLPDTGETGKLYITDDTNLVYRWSGSAYVEIAPSSIPGIAAVLVANAEAGAVPITGAGSYVANSTDYIEVGGADGTGGSRWVLGGDEGIASLFVGSTSYEFSTSGFIFNDGVRTISFLMPVSLSANREITFPDENGMLATREWAKGARVTATDDDFNHDQEVFITLPEISASRAFYPKPQNVHAVGRFTLWNQNTSGNIWNIEAPNAIDASGAYIFSIPNGAIYVFESDGSNWVKVN